MPDRKAFVVLLLLVASLGSGRGDDSSAFIDTKQEEVQTIAQAAAANYQNTCELVSTCLSSQNCSRLECYPFVNQNNETTCVYVDNNDLCTNSTGSSCNSIEANFERGYVRTPPLNYSSVGGEATQDVRELYLGNTICTQRNLDPTFMNVNNTLRTNSSLNYFYNVYFGSVDGSFRFYPGRELLSEDCGVYDPRIRPWYTGAISILKDVVVLIDTGSSMQQTNFLDPTTSYLEITKSIISLFVKTLTGGDRVTIIPVNGSGSATGQIDSQYIVPASQALDPTDPDFQGLLTFILNSSTLAGQWTGNGNPSNFTAGFQEAVSIFGQSSPLNSMKIVILITNSQSNNNPDESDLSAADDLKSLLGSQLFVYDLNPGNGSQTSGWGTKACGDGESKNYVSINPLLWLNSYFSFLARARVAVNGGPTPFWQTPYDDASDLGQVITVAYPAMSADGLQLIGVAGIDVQLAGLDSDPLLKTEVETVLTSSSYRLISLNPNAGNIPICTTAYQNSCPDVPTGRTQSLCYPSQIPADDDQLTALLCCEDCVKRSRTYIAVWISLGVLGAVALVLIFLVIFFVRRSKRRWATRQATELALKVYSYDVLRKATNGFALGNVIGRGSFGVVYKAVIGDKTVAVKQLNQAADRAKDFEAELKILGITCHSNLVELKGTCFRPTECFLVYELVDGGDLHGWLWPEVRSGHEYSSDSDWFAERFLKWNMRRVIARGVARGLNYLHRGLEPNGRVFHLDIKPHNILLEYNFNPKIADFGISQLYEPGFTFKCASVVRGTFGYIAPEVIQGQMLPNSKLDVYSYGMVLLQLMSGRKIDDPEVKPFLLQWARNHVEDGYVEKVVDEKLIATVREEHREILMANCKQMIRLALLCLSDRPERRPEMSDVLETIDSLQDVHDLETPSFSADYGPGSVWSVGPRNSTRSRELDHRLSPKLESESGNVQSPERNLEISPSVLSTETTGEAQIGPLENSASDSTQDGSGTLGRSSVETSFERSLEMAKVARESKPSTLRRSVSS